ncbi:hypothetical protein ACQKE9_00635 [Shewanella vesiculosa]|uniref:hypothetical protein n=1 Tax=Shewanella vesiculosa TaxID=518738 RepID=UPI003D072CCE
MTVLRSVITVLWIRDEGKLHDDCSGHRQSLFRPIRRATLGQCRFVLFLEPTLCRPIR